MDPNFTTFQPYLLTANGAFVLIVPIAALPKLNLLAAIVGVANALGLRMGPGMVWLTYSQTKGVVKIPLHGSAPEFADEATQRQPWDCISNITDRHMKSLTTAQGGAPRKKAAINWFSDAARSAGLKGQDRRTTHGLRVTCLTRLAERGATTHQIGAWGGHESLS